MNLANLTHGELLMAGLDNQMTFEFYSGGVCIGTPALGVDRERTMRVCLIDREIRNRWDSFVAFVELWLLCNGHTRPEKPKPVAP